MKRWTCAGSVIAWVAVWAFWFVVTRDAHPSRRLATWNRRTSRGVEEPA